MGSAWRTADEQREAIADLWAKIAVERARRGDVEGLERASANAKIAYDSAHLRPAGGR